MQLDICPYNSYIFYLAAIITVLCILFFLFKFFALNHAMMKLYEPACSLRKHTAQLESSMEKAETSFSKARKNAQVLAVLLPFVYLVRRTYKKEIPESGIKGYKKATTRVLRKDIERRELANTVRRILK